MGHAGRHGPAPVMRFPAPATSRTRISSASWPLRGQGGVRPALRRDGPPPLRPRPPAPDRPRAVGGGHAGGLPRDLADRDALRDQPRVSAMAWMLTMAHRRAVDRVRASQSSRDRDTKIGIRDFEREYDSVAETVEIRIESERVKRALDELTELQRQAVTLAYYGGFSHSEVAAMLHVPIGTVKTRLRDGMIRLRDEMGVTHDVAERPAHAERGLRPGRGAADEAARVRGRHGVLRAPPQRGRGADRHRRAARARGRRLSTPPPALRARLARPDRRRRRSCRAGSHRGGADARTGRAPFAADARAATTAPAEPRAGSAARCSWLAVAAAAVAALRGGVVVDQRHPAGPAERQRSSQITSRPRRRTAAQAASTGGNGAARAVVEVRCTSPRWC